MSPLRLIQSPATTDLDSKIPVEDPLLVHSFPVGVLIVRSRMKDEIEALAHRFHMTARWYPERHVFLVRMTDERDGEHKLQAIHLFLFFLRVLASVDASATGHLQELNRLELNMKNAIMNSSIHPDDAAMEKARIDLAEEGTVLLLGRETSLHLDQAGFPVNAQPGEECSLSKRELDGIYRELLDQLNGEETILRKAV